MAQFYKEKGAKLNEICTFYVYLVALLLSSFVIFHGLWQISLNLCDTAFVGRVCT